MRDEMALFSGIAQSYSTLPLSVLHQLQSVLTIEIEQRLLEFGVINVGNGVGKLGDVQGEKTALSGQNLQEKNVLYPQFRKGSSSQ